MKQLLMAAGAFVLSSMFIADYLGDKAAPVADNDAQPATIERAAPKAADKPAPIYTGEVRIPRDERGHYAAEFRLNNLRVDGLIDTGATTVAINESQARRAGIRLISKDFKYRVNTANGEVKAAKAMLDRVSIGSITVYDVEVAVLEDKALNVTLIGMSFMNRLKGFEYKSGNLVLKR